MRAGFRRFVRRVVCLCPPDGMAGGGNGWESGGLTADSGFGADVAFVAGVDAEADARAVSET